MSGSTYFYYHSIHTRNVVRKYGRGNEKCESEINWHFITKSPRKAFHAFKEIIESEIFGKEKNYFLDDLHRRYKMLFLEINCDSTACDIIGYTTNKLQDKIL